MLSLFLLLILSSVSSEEQGVYTVLSWDCGFDGRITLVPHEDLHGWNIHLKFSDVIYKLQPWDAKIRSTSVDHTEFVLTNVNYDKDVQAGRHLRINFTATTRCGIPPPTANVTIDVSKTTVGTKSSSVRTQSSSTTGSTQLSFKGTVGEQSIIQSTQVKPLPSRTRTTTTTTVIAKTAGTGSIGNLCVDNTFFNCQEPGVCTSMYKEHCSYSCGRCGFASSYSKLQTTTFKPLSTGWLHILGKK